MISRRLRVGMILGAALALCLSRSSFADPSECQEATSAYNSAISDISTALQSYNSCLASTDGHDNCSGEFELLKSAQDDFEDAVSTHESECN